MINGLRLVKDYKDTCPEYAKAGILEGIASLLFIVLTFVAIHAIRVQTLRSWKIYFPCGVVVCLIRIGVTIAFLVDYKVIKDCAGDSTIRTLVGAIVAALIYGSVVWEGRVLGNITRKYATDISFSN